MLGDVLAVEAAVLDKNLAGVGAGDDDARHINAGHVGLQRLRVDDGAARVERKLHAEAAQECIVRVVSGERKNEIVFQAHFAATSPQPPGKSVALDYNLFRQDFVDHSSEVG